DAVRIEARDGAHGHVVVVVEEQALLQLEVVAARRIPADLADLLAIHIIDGHVIGKPLVAAGRIPTHRRRVVPPHVVITCGHGDSFPSAAVQPHGGYVRPWTSDTIVTSHQMLSTQGALFPSGDP